MITLIDTSAWIEALRKEGDHGIRAQVAALLESGDARISEIILLELWNGASGKAEIKMLYDIEQTIPSLKCSPAVFEMSYTIARQCRSRGLTVPTCDILIFSVAQIYQVDLLENDSDFKRIQKIIE